MYVDYDDSALFPADECLCSHAADDHGWNHEGCLIVGCFCQASWEME